MSLINIVPTSPIVNIDVSDVSKVVLLPAASTCVGTTYNIRDWKAACSLINRIYLSTVGLDRVDGASLSTTQLQMTSSLEIVKIMSLGNTSWSVVGRNKTIASTLGISIRPYIPIASPLLVFGSLLFDVTGTVGGSPAKPKLTWSNSGGAVDSYTLNLLSGSTEALGTSLSLTPPAAGDTSYTYTGATVTDTYYSFLLVATNSKNSSTLSQPTPIRNRAAPNLTSGALTFDATGTVGGTPAKPKLTWSNSGGTVESYTLNLLSGSTAALGTSLSITPPAVGDTSYTYVGATVTDTYYSFLLVATNVTNSSTLTQPTAIRNRAAPNLTSGVLTFNGTLGTTSAAPRLTWSNSGGTVESYTLNLLSGSTSALGTSLSLTPPAVGDTSYTYAGATVNDTFYSFLLVATNVTNSSTLTQPTAIRNRAAPVITLTSFTFGGTAGSTSAAPTLVWSSTGGAVESYALVVYGDANSTPTTVLSSTPPASGDLSYAYPGSTVASFYYQMVLTATNVTSPTSVITTSVILNLSPPILSQTSFVFAGTKGSINANPTLTWSNSGGAVVSYTLTLKNGATSPPGTSVTLTPPASGATTTNYVYTYFANGDPMPVTGSSITITNVSGSTIVRFRITDSYGVISDTSGLSVAMGQTYTFSLPRDLTPNTYEFSILAYYGGGSPNQQYIVTSNNGLISITTFFGTFLNVGLSKFTIASYYYQYVLVGTNAGGSNTLTTSIISNVLLSQWEPNTDTGVDNKEWSAVASSSDGTIFVATYYNGIYTSLNAGSTWSSVSGLGGLNNWSSVAMTPDGSKAFATRLGGQIYISSYPFTSWTARATSISWGSIACSSDGTKLVAGVRNGYIWTSTDSGVNWSTNSNSSTFKFWYSVASSSDGTKLVAVLSNFSVGGFIYRSTDSGVSWSVILSDASRGWRSIACSSDGTTLVAVAASNYIWISTDSGANWSSALNDATRGWSSVACSSDGSKIVAVISGGSIYTSINSGASWSEYLNDTVRYWAGVALTPGGSKAVAVASNNTPAIYIGT